jgi:uroporphyrinogen III methyltransferase/synthase
MRIAAVGPKTAAALAEAGREVDFVPSAYEGETLAAELPLTAGAHVLLPRAAQGGNEIVDLLRARGATVDDLPIYDTVPPVVSDADVRAARDADLLTFTSGSTARNFVEAIGSPLPETPVICIGPATEKTAREIGLNVVGVASPHTIEGLLQAVHEYFAAAEGSS